MAAMKKKPSYIDKNIMVSERVYMLKKWYFLGNSLRDSFIIHY